MHETQHKRQLAVLFSRGDAAVTARVVSTLECEGWHVEVLSDLGGLPAEASAADRSVDGVVFVPGLLTAESGGDSDPSVELLGLVDGLSPRLRSAAEGGARIVVVGSRDWLGWPSRPRLAAQAAGLVATVRSLALAMGRRGVTVNLVAALPPGAASRRARGEVPGTHLHEPVALTASQVTEDDIAATVSFFLDSRSGYVTGQVLHCCGGASLLSSLSV